jgi:hypothetical protein
VSPAGADHHNLILSTSLTPRPLFLCASQGLLPRRVRSARPPRQPRRQHHPAARLRRPALALRPGRVTAQSRLSAMAELSRQHDATVLWGGRLRHRPLHQRRARPAHDLASRPPAGRSTAGGASSPAPFPAIGEHIQGRSLLTPDEIMRVGPDRPIVMIAGEPPWLLDRIDYLTDPAYAGRFDPNPMHLPTAAQ